MYSTGETEKAMRYFLGLLKGSNHRITVEGQMADAAQEDVNYDKIYLEDFRVAFQVCFRLMHDTFVSSTYSSSLSIL